MSLRRLFGLMVATYTFAAALIVGGFGLVLHEEAERMVWRAVLERALATGEDRGSASENRLQIVAYGSDAWSALLDDRPPGLYDDVTVGGRSMAILIEGEGTARRAALLPVDAFEREERRLLALLVVAAVSLAAFLIVSLSLVGRRITGPFERLAGAVRDLELATEATSLLDGKAPAEAETIARAVETLVARAREALASERAFAESVSHELRTPLSAMQGTIDGLLARDALPDKLRPRIERLARNAAAMQETVEMLLVLARHPERLVTLAEPIELAALLAEMVEEQRAMHSARQPQLMLAISAEPVLWAPAASLRAVIGNLLRNAIQHGGEGEVTVRLEAPARVTIADPGPGFDLDAIAARWREQVRSRAPGTGGIGLSLTRPLVSHLGWRLTSRPGEGGGTVVELDLSPALRSGAAD